MSYLPNLMPADELEFEAMKGRDIRVLSYYDILENEDHELMFSVKQLPFPRSEGFEPRMYYDGGEHTIFLKNEHTVVICDCIHPGVRGSLGKVSEVLIAELADGEIAEEYMSGLLLADGVEKLATQLIEYAIITGEYTDSSDNNDNDNDEIEEMIAENHDRFEDITVELWPDENPTQKKVVKIIAYHFGCNAAAIAPDDKLRDDIGMDDLDFIELTMALEEEYELIIPEWDYAYWRTVGDVVKYITKQTQGE